MFIRLKFHTILGDLRQPTLAAEVIDVETGDTVSGGPLSLIKQWLDARGFTYVSGTNGIWRAA